MRTSEWQEGEVDSGHGVGDGKVALRYGGL